MNFSIVFPLCSNLLNSATFTDFSSPPPNSFLISAKNSPTFSYSSNSPSKSSSMFSFQISTNPPYIYDSTYCICSFTSTPLILIHIYSLYAVINPAIFPELPLNSYSLTTLTYMLGHVNVATLFAPPSSACVIIAYSAANCSYCCQTTCSKLMSCQLIVVATTSHNDQ